MTGRREQLSKAFVIACVAAAHQQKRDIQLVAFSSASNVIETGPLSANTQGIRRLLDFLSSSFGGGTDITGALKHAMETVARHSFSSVEEDARDGHKNNDAELNSRNSEESSNRQRQKTPTDMAAADILLVTDGEIPDPPVSDAVMDALDRLKYHADVQVHGLLVGKRESAPLSNVCTHVYDFLIDYERILPTTVRQKGFARGTGMGQLSTFSRSRNTKLLSMAVHRSKRWAGPTLVVDCGQADCRYYYEPNAPATMTGTTILAVAVGAADVLGRKKAVARYTMTMTTKTVIQNMNRKMFR